MASKKSRQKQVEKRTRADLRRLRDMGFISKTVNLRKKPTAKDIKIIEKYRDVLRGKATVVPVPKGKTKAYKGYRPYKGKMVIPREKGEKVSVDKKTGIPFKTKGGIKTWLPGRGMKMPPPAKGTARRYTIRFKNLRKSKRKIKGGTERKTDDSRYISFDRLSGGGGGGGGSLSAYMEAYEDTFPDWYDYLEIEDYPSDFDMEGYGDDMEEFGEE